MIFEKDINQIFTNIESALIHIQMEKDIEKKNYQIGLVRSALRKTKENLSLGNGLKLTNTLKNMIEAK